MCDKIVHTSASVFTRLPYMSRMYLINNLKGVVLLGCAFCSDSQWLQGVVWGDAGDAHFPQNPWGSRWLYGGMRILLRIHEALGGCMGGCAFCPDSLRLQRRCMGGAHFAQIPRLQHLRIPRIPTIPSPWPSTSTHPHNTTHLRIPCIPTIPPRWTLASAHPHYTTPVSLSACASPASPPYQPLEPQDLRILTIPHPWASGWISASPSYHTLEPQDLSETRIPLIPHTQET